MIKLFVSDLDGTLLNALHCSDDVSESAVKKVLQENKHFAIATGRHLHQNHLVGIGFIDEPIYKIAMNGAIIRDPHNEVIWKKAIDSQAVAQLEEAFPSVSFECITQKGVYVKSSRWTHLKSVFRQRASFKMLVKYTVMLFSNAYHFKSNPSGEVLMIAARIGDEQTARAVTHFLEAQEEMIDYGPNLRNFEIVASGVNKKEAAAWLARYLSVAEEDVAVYGNDLNDVPMLAHFKHSYAPENAVEKAREAAEQIVESNHQNGVAKHILRTLEREKNEQFV